MTTDAMREFGVQVAQRRLDLGWSREKLASEALGNPDRKGYVGQVERGLRNLTHETIDKFVQALDLPAEVAKAALIGPKTAPEPEEVKQDEDAEKLLRKVRNDPEAPQTAEALLIALAYEHAGGPHIDLFTAYTSLRKALEAAAAIRERGEMPDNTGGQLQAVMKEVARLNDLGNRDEAADLLDQEMARLEQVRDKLFAEQLSQDRVRNRPDLAAERLIKDQYRQAPPGGVFWAVDRLFIEWLDRGDREGDMFALQVALEMAKANHAKAKKALHGASLHSLAVCHWRIGQRSLKPRHLTVAQNAAEGALKHRSKKRDPLNWAASQDTLGNILSEIATRDRDPVQMQRAVDALREALKVTLKHGTDHEIATTWNNLGAALQALGELTQQPEPVREAISCYEKALALTDPQTGKERQDDELNNLGVAWRWLGALTGDLAALDTAARHYADCLPFRPRETAAFMWAATQWNLGDLALARYELTKDPALLTTARGHVMDARAVFVEGSDHQTGRCDDLLARIDAAKPD